MNPVQRVGIVTGSATGVGAAVTRQLAARGVAVVVNYTRSESEAEATAAACRAHGAECIVVRGDVADDGACREIVGRAVDAWGRVDFLVNNAAKTKFVPYRNLQGLSAEDFLEIYRVNVVGAFQMARAVEPLMRSQGGGAIVNTSSIGGVTGIASSMAYAASKAALNMLTRSLALALGPEIRVNTVVPGPIQGRWLRGGLGEEQYDSMLELASAAAPLARVPTPDEIAEVIVWLLTSASVVSGTTIPVDAGIHLGRLPDQYNRAEPEERVR